MRYVLLVVALVIFLAACGKEGMPYKSLADLKLTTPTGNVVGSEKAPEPVSSEGPSCKDSDHGDFPTGAGKVRGLLEDGSEFEEADKCFGNILYEYNCDDNNVSVTQHKCRNGCQNGFCI